MIDLQINGFAGVDFNSDELKGEDLLRASMTLKNIGIHKFLPTLITAPIDKMRARAAKLALMVEENEELNQMIPGFTWKDHLSLQQMDTGGASACRCSACKSRDRKRAPRGLCWKVALVNPCSRAG